MTTRTELVERLARLVGTDLRLLDVRNGWPAIGELATAMGAVPIAMFIASVGRAGRDSDDEERRIQNPGQNRPIIVPPSTIPVVLGLWDADELMPVATPVIMAADAWKREGLITRHSVFVRLAGLLEAQSLGWDARPNTKGETITCFHPTRLKAYVEALLIETVKHPGTQRLPRVLAVLPDSGEPAVEREKRAAMQLVRDARFSARVISSYSERCALCDLDLGLVQGAHIYPVAAPDSPDEPWNGLSLCANHHVAFDRHYIFVEPTTRSVQLHPWLKERAADQESCQAFLRSTNTLLKEPREPAARPREEMFRKRYAYFDGSYDWAASPE